MEKKNNIQEIIKDLTNKKEPIANQIKILFESVDKFKHKRHLIILSYLLGYYFSKGNNLFNKDILQNSLEIFEKSLTRKTDMANLMIAIALSLNKCNEVEKVSHDKCAIKQKTSFIMSKTNFGQNSAISFLNWS